MPDNITCPKCGAGIPLTDAVTHSLRDEFTREFAEKQRALEAKVAAQDKQFEAKQKQFEQQKSALDAEIAQRLEAERKKLTDAALTQARAGLAMEMTDLKMQLTEGAKKLAETQRNELELRKGQRALEERAANMDLELARKLDAERAKVQEEARRKTMEEQQFVLADKEKHINQLKEQIEALQQKAQQGSQQMQGEVMELQLEDMLRQAFPLDVIEPVPTGVRGADLLQRVKNALGETCATIIWESKRTKNWAGGWAGKLKDDQRAQGAELAVIVSQALPEGITHFGPYEGVWACGFAYVVPLATALRQGLQQVAATRRAESGKGEKMEVLYQFLTSPQFKGQVESIVEAFTEMKSDLDSERRAMEKIWRKREAQLGRVLTGTSGLYGSLQGIVGSAALPEIKALELGE
jgi:hypothetical protein